MKQHKYLLFLIFAIAQLCNAAVPFETPYYAIGSDFIATDGTLSGTAAYDSIYPRINVLFDNTKIYLDNNNDGVWDYSFSGNAGNSVVLNPSVEAPKFGAKIRTDKPVAYYHSAYVNTYYSGGSRAYVYSLIMPPINSWKKEYGIITPNSGSWNILTDKNITVFIEDSSKTTNVSVAKGEKKSVSFSSYARVYSNDTFAISCISSVGAIKGKSFFAPYNTLRIFVMENATSIEIDSNNDGFFDTTTNYNKGVYDITVLEGAKIRSSKDIALFALIYNVVSAVAPANMLGNDNYALFGHSIGLFSEFTSSFNRTSYETYTQKTNSLNSSGQAYPNSRYTLPGNIGSMRVWSNIPTWVGYMKYQQDSSATEHSVNIHPTSQIYHTQYSLKKYISNNQPNTFVIRVFNPFLKDKAYNINVDISYPQNFSGPTNIIIEKKNLMTDAILESSSASIEGVGNSFSVKSQSNPILSLLEPMHYIEIRYDLVTPDYFSKFEFPSSRLTYDADTWVIE